VLFSMNLLLAALNLIPVPPLDGSAAVSVVLPERVATVYQRFLLENGQLIALLGLLVAWRVIDVTFGPIFGAAINLLHWGSSYS
jgi:Zn-dependent protease